MSVDAPCPFCGHRVSRIVCLDFGLAVAHLYRVECDAETCAARGPLAASDGQARAAWERRAVGERQE